MEKNNIQIEEWMKELSERFESSASPETRSILEKVRNGDLGIEDAMRSLTEQVFKDPTQVEHLYEIATNMPLATPKPQAQLYQPPVGLPRLDPEYEAMLHERLQFDEDAPELRTEGKPADVPPAVPVEDAPTSSIALGKALQMASEKVAEDFKKLVEIKGLEGVYLPTMEQPQSYPVGSVPPVIKVETTALAALSEEEEQLFAWKSISTTQGRRSLVSNLTQGIICELNGFGYNVSEGVFNATVRDSTLAVEKWDISVLGSGPCSTNQNFSYFHTAVKAMAMNLRIKLQTKDWDKEKPLKLMVSTWDQYSDRMFGWLAFLCEDS